MNPISEIRTIWQSIPDEVQHFLKRALIIFIIWKLIYHLFLFNGRVIDKPLTDWSTNGAEKMLHFFYPAEKIMVKEDCKVEPELNNELICKDFLFFNGTNILGIADACNALELYVLYLGFLLSFSSPVKRTLTFSVVGIFVIYISNILRLTALASLNMHRIDAVDMAHHYVFKIIVYALIFGLWVSYTKKKL